MQHVIIGAGAIGGTVGAYMIRAGHDVLFVDAAADHVQAIHENGLTIKGYDNFTVKAKAVTPDKLKGPLKSVFLATKSMATEGAVRSIMEMLDPDGYVVSLQNGLNETKIAELIGPERTIGCFVNFSADYHGPGLIHYGGPGTFMIGELDGKMTDRIMEIERVLGAWGKVQATENIFGYLWGKMGYGSMLFATSLTNETMGDCIDRNRVLMVEVAREVLRVAEALGVKYLGFDGYDPDLYMQGDWEAIHKSIDRLVELRAKDEKKHAGIWRDLVVRKRKTEVDTQPGAVVAEGLRLGIPTPKLKKIVEMIHEIEDGKRTISTENLAELMR